MNDEILIKQLFSLTQSVLDALRAQYGRLCLSVARRILPDERDVEECLSETLFRVWDSIPPQRPASLGAYMARIARNLALDRLDYNRAGARSTALTAAFEELEACLPAAGDAEQAAESGELRETLNRFLRAQPENARVCFLRRYWYGESIAEIAGACHLREGTVKSLLFRTRARLREALEKEGINV